MRCVIPRVNAVIALKSPLKERKYHQDKTDDGMQHYTSK